MNKRRPRKLLTGEPVTRPVNRHYDAEYLEFKCPDCGGVTFVTATPSDNPWEETLSDRETPVPCQGCIETNGQAVWTGRTLPGREVSRIIEGEGAEYRETPPEAQRRRDPA